MVLHVVRALMVLLMGGVGWAYLGVFRHYADPKDWLSIEWLSMAVALVMAVLVMSVDILAPRSKLSVFAGTFFGLLVGLLIAYGLSFAIQLAVDMYINPLDLSKDQIAFRDQLVRFLNMVTGIACCYTAISFILQTKDDFRFIIPYVEFAKQLRGPKPMIVDTSVIIDGRLCDIVATGFVDSRLIVPRFVLTELQTLADSADKLKRNRGRRGLDMLKQLQSDKTADVILYDWTGHSSPEAEGADQMLLVLAKEVNGRVLSNDVNLAKVAALRGVQVISINQLARSMRPVVLAGEKMDVTLIKIGEDPTQGVGYLEDGTMVVVDQGRGFIGQKVEIIITNLLQTATGQMVFGRLEEATLANGRRPKMKDEKDKG